MTIFVPYGPFNVPTQKARNGKMPHANIEKVFWEQKGSDLKSLSDARGCYIFAIRAAKGYIPWYVGKTAKASFSKEIFNGDNKYKYSCVLSNCGKGNPVMFFVAYPPDKKGPANQPFIDKVETFLIEKCRDKNAKLLNKHKAHLAKWAIEGIVRAGQGQPTIEAQELKRLITK